ncbi:MAG: short-chain dehydrogenase [Candidatus Rokuibacteriota bacterium]|nr:MAG: short-chain dehydrogenase [Candidatus Rokubacteria bacterium]
MRRRHQRFGGHAVFITGASSGIGAALAHEFAHEGADVALAARRRERLQALAAEIERGGRRALVIPCDVTRDGDLERAVALTRTALALDDYRRQFETNVFGVLRTVYATLEDLKKTRGRLVLLGSVSGHVGLPGSSAYSMSKFAVRGLAASLAYELEPYGVAVTLISPGFVESEIRQVDNRGVWRREPPKTPIPRALVMPAPTAARRIVRAVARRRREAVITGFGKTAVIVQRHLPWLLTAAVRRFGIKSRGEPR